MVKEAKPPRISVVLPVYNEEGTLVPEIESVRKALDTTGETYEIIVVDDASTDRTYELARDIPGITLMRHAVNRGAGAARKTGTLAAGGEIVVWTDVDMSYPNHLIPELLKEMNRRQLDQVVGARDSEKGTCKFLRVPAKFLIRKLAAFLTRAKIPDLNSGMRAFRQDLFLRYIHLVPDGFSCTSTMTMAFLSNGHSVGYLPIPYRKRVGASKFHFVRDTYQYLLQVIRIIMYFDPLRVFLPVSFLLAMVGVATSFLNFRRTGGIEQSDIVIFMSAIMVWVIGLLADLIVMQSRKDRV